MQKIILIGNLGKDPETIIFEGGNKITTINVGVTERGFKTKEGKEIPSHTEWFSCVLRYGLADVAEKYLHKGNKVYIEGKMRTRDYENKDKQKVYIKEVIVESMELLTPKSDEPQLQQSQQTQSSHNDLPF